MVEYPHPDVHIRVSVSAFAHGADMIEKGGFEL